jgi:E3 ubiquitin-protein ligase HERC2
LFDVLTGPTCDSVEDDMNASARGASATVLEETRKETAPVQLPVSGPELAAMMKIGTRVMRGVDWKWGDQVFRDFTNILAHLTYQWKIE